MKLLSFREKEYRLGLRRTERRAIVPIKWFLLVITVAIWLVVIDRAPGAPALRFPDRQVLALFIFYFAFNSIETYLLYFRKINLQWIRPVTLVSYLTDVIYITLLIYFHFGTYYVGEGGQSNFYIIYFLLVMRGFALFSTVIETLFVNALITMLFILALRLQLKNFAFMAEPDFVVQLVFIWFVVIMAWFIMVVLNQQKMDLIRANERLSRAESLAQIGELAAGVAHEINNPLGIITASADYIERSSPPEDPRLEEIRTIRHESNRCHEIIRQLLTYAKPKKGDVIRLDPAALNEEVLQFVFPKGRAGKIELVMDLDGDLTSFRADPNLVKQALLNLYLNARQSIPDAEPGRIISRIYESNHPKRVTFEIEDNGVGIESEDMERVFDPFFTRKAKGTGLGLSVTQRIVESFGGEIVLAPASPRGTIVRMIFPRAGA